MHSQEILVFYVRHLQYGIPVHCVREIFPLPELTPAPDAPGDIIGLLNWRGQVLPVMHLDRRLGQPMQPCSLSDSIIVIDWHNIQVGVLVNQVEDVISIDSQCIEQEIDYGRDNHINTAFLTGVAKQSNRMLLLLNLEALIRLADDVAMMIWKSEMLAYGMDDDGQLDDSSQTFLQADTPPSIPESELKAADFYTLYCPTATDYERSVFQKRTEDLKRSHEHQSQTLTNPIAVLKLANEYLGLPLAWVREFISLAKINPIPCCPNHIVGNLNLRGEIVTLVDIKSMLNLNLNGVDHQPFKNVKAVIVQVGEIIAGIAVDDIHEILYSHESSVSTSQDNQHWVTGVTSYDQKLISILDLPALMRSDVLSVNESA
jgi:purine-binding chemotaxis protein CheW